MTGDKNTRHSEIEHLEGFRWVMRRFEDNTAEIQFEKMATHKP